MSSVLVVAFDDGKAGDRLGIYDDGTVTPLEFSGSLFDLAKRAADTKEPLVEILQSARGSERLAYSELEREGAIRIPIAHSDPAHMLLTGTGLTHRNSALSRDRMHSSGEGDQATDTIRMYRIGEAGGQPNSGECGAPPEWFYKGDGSALVHPGGALLIPSFGKDGGEETEIAGIYMIDAAGNPRRIGYALANEFSDHVIEKENYLYLAHSKLRQSSFGPAILIGDLPQEVAGSTTITRGADTVWQADFKSGDAHMCHSIANLEHHHFKYELFRRPGDLHVHYFGAATVSFGDDIVIRPGDEICIESPIFGPPLRNTVEQSSAAPLFTDIASL